MFFKNKVGMAYELDDSFEKGKFILYLYTVHLNNGSYEYRLYKKVSSLNLEVFYKMIEEVGAKPKSYYMGQDFGRKLKKVIR